jgi:hypothetical protein
MFICETYVVLITLSKGANSLGPQVQRVVEILNFLHEGTQGLILNSQETVVKALIAPLQATCKTIFKHKGVTVVK